MSSFARAGPAWKAARGATAIWILMLQSLCSAPAYIR